jgi:hypothetical protein
MSRPDTHPLVDFLLRLERYGLENTEQRRFYSKYPGVVESTDDPSQEGRIKVVVDVLGQDSPMSLWAMPSSPYAGPDVGFYTPPEVGCTVWVWFDHGDIEQPNFSGGWWCNPERNTDAESKPSTSHVPQEFKTEGSPTTRGLKTKKGLILIEDDVARDPRVEISTISPVGVGVAATPNHVFTMSDQPGASRIQLVSTTGHILLFDDQNQLLYLGKRVAGQFVGPILTLDQNKGNALLSTPTASIELTDAQQKILLAATKGIDLDTIDIIANAAGKIELMAQLASTISAVAGLTLVASAGAAMLSGLTVTLASTTAAAGILLGTGAVLRLVTEALIAIFNANVAIFSAHTHTTTSLGTGNLGLPVVSAGVTSGPLAAMAPADLDSVTTNTTRAT